MTRNKILSGITITAIAAIMIAWAPSVAYAGNGGAIVITDGGCGMLDGNGASAFVTDSHAVGTFSENGNTMIWCKGTGLAHPGGPAVIFQGPGHNNGKATTLGMNCSTGFDSTPNWFNIVAPSGEGMLICIFPGGTQP